MSADERSLSQSILDAEEKERLSEIDYNTQLQSEKLNLLKYLEKSNLQVLTLADEDEIKKVKISMYRYCQ